MKTPKPRDPEVQALQDELALVLQRMADETCNSMVPLWLQGTLRIRRKHFGPQSEGVLSFEPSKELLALGKSCRSKYQALACWRHAVLWRNILEKVEPEFARATKAVYFTRFPPDQKPFSWSKKVSDAPDAGGWPSPSTLKNHAKEGCWHSVAELRKEVWAAGEGRAIDEVKRKFLEAGSAKTLRHQLKLDEHYPNWETP